MHLNSHRESLDLRQVDCVTITLKYCYLIKLVKTNSKAIIFLIKFESDAQQRHSEKL